MKTIKIQHVNGPDQNIISLWHRYRTKINDIIEVNEQEAAELLAKEFDDKPVFEIVKQEPTKKELQKELQKEMPAE